ncbi:MAG: oxygen-independent coproporphyrinogen III oxidase [Cytophagales bacterium]|nr:MAG: oxygen-independent coproporphyrinogen III oxidase [Cytophagales bacterium]
MNPSPKNIYRLIEKYDKSVPRYTSYPTVPFWQTTQWNPQDWQKQLSNQFKQAPNQAISLYIHLPYCENLCTYCGCNKRITKNHAVEMPYIEAVLEEWKYYVRLLGKKPIVSELHLGGGTPTFFSAESLRKLIEGIFKEATPAPTPAFSVEIHPTVTNTEHLTTLYELGFRRLSVGIQDFDQRVQAIINRHQTFEETQYIFQQARNIGYEAINADIVYGLPLQTTESICLTMKHIQTLKPERIAFYSYAHVPWKSKGQRRYTEADLPNSKEKIELYLLGKEILRQAGYKEIGFDHFALPKDALYKAAEKGQLHRNFMGYTTQNTQLLIGLGASSISDTGTMFAQNEKTIEAYLENIQQKGYATHQGHTLNEEDQLLRKHILELMCQLNTDLSELPHYLKNDILPRLGTFIDDDLITLEGYKIQVTTLGRTFLRNICLCLDSYYWSSLQKNKEKETPLFSKAI